MTLKSLLGGAAIVALAMAAGSAGALAADPYKSSTTPSMTTTGNAPSTQTPSTPGSDTGTMNSNTQSSAKTHGAGVSLTSVDNPQQTLANAQLQDKSGQTVGTVKQIVLGSNGKAKDVFIDVNGKTVSVAASKLKFDQGSNILFTSMTQEQINALPQAKGI